MITVVKRYIEIRTGFVCDGGGGEVNYDQILWSG